jgi:hypothetical protein
VVDADDGEADAHVLVASWGRLDALLAQAREAGGFLQKAVGKSGVLLRIRNELGARSQTSKKRFLKRHRRVLA